MVIAPATLQTGVGITRHFTATGTFSDGSIADVTASATWATQTTGIASVSNGAASGLALGSTGVTATHRQRVGRRHGGRHHRHLDRRAADAHRTRGGPHRHAAARRQAAGGGRREVGGAGTAAADLFDPVGATWTSVAPMNVMRSSHTATLLADGRVLVAGGSTVSSAAAKGYVNNASAEIYDPVANTWTATPPMSVARSHHTATLLPDGKVLVVGGENLQYLVERHRRGLRPGGQHLDGHAHAPISPRSQHTATLLPSGLVLIAGGFDIVDGRAHAARHRGAVRPGAAHDHHHRHQRRAPPPSSPAAWTSPPTAPMAFAALRPQRHAAARRPRGDRGRQHPADRDLRPRRRLRGRRKAPPRATHTLARRGAAARRPPAGGGRHAVRAARRGAVRSRHGHVDGRGAACWCCATIPPPR